MYDVQVEVLTPDGAVGCPDVRDDDNISRLPKGQACVSNAPLCDIVLTTPCGGDAGGFMSMEEWACVCKDESWDCVVKGEGLGGGCPGGDAACPDGIPYAPRDISNECLSCCNNPGGVLNFDPCCDYFNCRFCTCTGSRTECIQKCDSFYDSGSEGVPWTCCGPHEGGLCPRVFQQLEDCAQTKCKTECAGQPILQDAGALPDSGQAG